MFGKRGLSKVIALLLIILFVIILMMLLYNFIFISTELNFNELDFRTKIMDVKMSVEDYSLSSDEINLSIKRQIDKLSDLELETEEVTIEKR
jgi:hypothetical protein